MKSAVFLWEKCQIFFEEGSSSAEFDKIFPVVQKKLECKRFLQYSYFVKTNNQSAAMMVSR